ncbi:MAG: nucleotidyl transferase AbiEii/AbiGii toxin family protein, partial [Armatimonadia bacterium]
MHAECLEPAAAELLPHLASALSSYAPVLAGGTALALHLGHLMSFDFDFFTVQHFEPPAVLRDVQRVCAPVDVLQLQAGTVVVLVHGVKVSLFEYPYPLVGPVSSFEGASVASVLDVAAMKLVAILQRGAKRDFVDLWAVLQHVPFRQVAHVALLRFGPTLLEPVVIGKALVWFADADTQPDPRWCGTPVEWSTIKRFFRSSAPQFVLDLEAERGG